MRPKDAVLRCWRNYEKEKNLLLFLELAVDEENTTITLSYEPKNWRIATEIASYMTKAAGWKLLKTNKVEELLPNKLTGETRKATVILETYNRNWKILEEKLRDLGFEETKDG